jgi:hypothetical protein
MVRSPRSDPPFALPDRGCTATLYTASKKLAGILSLPLTLHHTLAPGLKTPRKDDPETHKFDNVQPEVALIATVVVVLRLIYGLDGKKRLSGFPFGDEIVINTPKVTEIPKRSSSRPSGFE